MTRPASITSPTLSRIFPLKSSKSIYAVQFIITFCHFINPNVAKFYDWMLSLIPTQYGDGAHYSYWYSISRWLPRKHEEWFGCVLDEDFIPPSIKLVFQEAFVVMKLKYCIILWSLKFRFCLFLDLNEQNVVHGFTDPPSVTSLPTISMVFILQNLYVIWGLFLKTRERRKTSEFQVYKGIQKCIFMNMGLKNI